MRSLAPATFSATLFAVLLPVTAPAWAAAPAPRAAATAASAPLPAVNLLVQVRLVDVATAEAGDDSAAENLRRRNQGYTVGTQPSGANAPWAQQAQVLNGESASLQMGQGQPFQWVRASAQQAGTNGGAATGAVVNEVSWLPSGTSWSVRPEWAGGAAAVRVQIEVRATALQPGHGQAPMPAVSASQYRSTVMAPLGSWVTVARTGGAAARNATGGGQTWSTEQLSNPARVLQVQVSQP